MPQAARREIAMIKVVAPQMAQRVIDRAIQVVCTCKLHCFPGFVGWGEREDGGSVGERWRKEGGSVGERWRKEGESVGERWRKEGGSVGERWRKEGGSVGERWREEGSMCLYMLVWSYSPLLFPITGPRCNGPLFRQTAGTVLCLGKNLAASRWSR